VEDQSNPISDPTVSVQKFCLELEKDRRTPEGRIRNEHEFREHFFPYDGSGATDRLLRLMPRDIRGPIIASWGIRGQKAACRDDEARVLSVVHDAFVAGDIDDQGFEDGLSPETVVSWCDLSDWWGFWRGGKHTKSAIQRALELAYGLGLFDAEWFFDMVEAGDSRGTDVLCDGLNKAELAGWIKKIHETADGSPKGMLGALGWATLVTKTSNTVLLAVIDAFAKKVGLDKEPARAEGGAEARRAGKQPTVPGLSDWSEPAPDEASAQEDVLLGALEEPQREGTEQDWLENPVVPAATGVDDLDVEMLGTGGVAEPTGAIADLLADDDGSGDDLGAPARRPALPGLPAGLAKRQKSVPPPLPDGGPTSKRK
jgi:hypothetical protein